MSGEAPIRVLQVVDSLGMGGAETWLMELLRLWAKHNLAQVDFLATSGNPGVFDDEASELGARVHYARYGRARLPQFVREFRTVLRDGRYNAIHDHQDYVSGWHYLMGTGQLPPIRVTHVHNPAYQIRNNYGVTASRRVAARFGKGLVARYATHVTGTSRQVITEYGFDSTAFRQIPKAALHCGFATERFLGDPLAAKSSVCREFGWLQDTKILLFAGRIDQSVDLEHPQNHKNSGFAVSIALECARRNPRVCMVLAGRRSEPASSQLEERVLGAGLAGRIQFLGVRRDVARLMLAADALLFPSRGEGLGMVAVEAQAAGLPVLASTAVPRECVVVPELVRFQRLDAGGDQWATDLLELISLRREVAGANRRVAESPFAIERSSAALLKLYRAGNLG